jgi:hypothetical protein
VHANTARITEGMRRLTDSTSSSPSPAIFFSNHYIATFSLVFLPTSKRDQVLVQQVMSPLLPLCDLTLHPHHCLHEGTKRSKRSLNQHINNTLSTIISTTTTATSTHGCPSVNEGSNHPGCRPSKRHKMVLRCQANHQVPYSLVTSHRCTNSRSRHARCLACTLPFTNHPPHPSFHHCRRRSKITVGSDSSSETQQCNTTRAAGK